MTIRLTETAINKAIREVAAARTRRDLSDETESGLRLRVSTTGSGTWVLACRDREGRMRRFQLGTWPEMGIRDAREEARAMRVRVKREGADPIADAKRERAAGEAARAGDGSLASVLDLYADKVGHDQKAWVESRKRVNKVFGSLLKRLAIALTLSDLQLATDSYAFPKSAAFAVRTLRPVRNGRQRQDANMSRRNWSCSPPPRGWNGVSVS